MLHCNAWFHSLELYPNLKVDSCQTYSRNSCMYVVRMIRKVNHAFSVKISSVKDTAMDSLGE